MAGVVLRWTFSVLLSENSIKGKAPLFGRFAVDPTTAEKVRWNLSPIEAGISCFSYINILKKKRSYNNAEKRRYS